MSACQYFSLSVFVAIVLLFLSFMAVFQTIALRCPVSLHSFLLWTSTFSRYMSADRVFCQVFVGLLLHYQPSTCLHIIGIIHGNLVCSADFYMEIYGSTFNW